MLNRFLSAPQNLPPLEDPMAGFGGPGYAPAGYLPQSQDSIGSSSSSSSSSSSGNWFGGLFSSEKKEGEMKDDSRTKVLESFDSPSAPVPSFEFK